ncbi:stage II sporulation protein M [Pseudoxanthomonas suwonensis]|uniref:stage II sporulation protein M n=1 Tax=Pseudoxanthomonas suwonensis TaxID=314722 RepID=UPI00138EF9BC|nr:stage II sporulation protein M [Pseudoxanthomonas suwonensis]KAF1699680.1 hypothetical protein CSC68_14420 [Pseudoxanthomonas suwonensis]
MRQEQFVARHQAEWQELELWLHHRARARGAPRPGAPATVPDGEIPARYRRLCQQLALARRRGYSAPLLERLQRLMQEGHAVLYRAPPPRWRMAAQFVAGGFPRLVRSQATVMWASLALFALPLVVAGLLVLWRPELAHNVMGPEQLAQLERMYDSGDPARALGRDSGTDWRMFGHYVMNNGSIGLRMFAGGLLAGVGTVFVLVFNGLAIGTAAGYLQAVGHGGPFWRFVCTHAALELTALVIAGGAGLRLGMALVAPGNRRRRDALVHAGRIGARLSFGVALMLVAAAFVEAFWSSIAWLPDWLRFGVAALLWAVVLGWLWRGGRGTEDADAT